MTVSKIWCKLDIDSDSLDLYTNKHDDWNLVFAHHKEEDEMYLLTRIEIAEAQRKDQELKVYYKKNAQMPQKDTSCHLIEDTKVLYINGKIRKNWPITVTYSGALSRYSHLFHRF
jgi:hypothetical protein